MLGATDLLLWVTWDKGREKGDEVDRAVNHIRELFCLVE